VESPVLGNGHAGFRRIFTATQAGDLKEVRNLQKLMLRSRGNALCSVRRVTEHTHCQRRLPDGSAGAPVLCSPD
jgi:RNA-directed DNA polymerase